LSFKKLLILQLEAFISTAVLCFFVFTWLITSYWPPCEMQNLLLHKVHSTSSTTLLMKGNSLLILSLMLHFRFSIIGLENDNNCNTQSTDQVR
jgi:hypothetical protein